MSLIPSFPLVTLRSLCTEESNTLKLLDASNTEIKNNKQKKQNTLFCEFLRSACVLKYIKHMVLVTILYLFLPLR